MVIALGVIGLYYHPFTLSLITVTSPLTLASCIKMWKIKSEIIILLTTWMWSPWNGNLNSTLTHWKNILHGNWLTINSNWVVENWALGFRFSTTDGSARQGWWNNGCHYHYQGQHHLNYKEDNWNNELGLLHTTNFSAQIFEFSHFCNISFILTLVLKKLHFYNHRKKWKMMWIPKKPMQKTCMV